ncbi:hypothetical protein KIF53_13965 [Chromobacterium subtsugae]|uniref:Uncharacterized protein n=1 Tax=Chromobacterium subtsugae TaxID=251747 RepID=A0ABS7FF97_9NEIS|nr:hypothetical protein [Chromobacterium subtsugae]MBW8288737.1 hypothetical protein [Chromobacterium subtsugae]WVH58409.1 hypothetical protein U6151_14215 [Chromobacterium subtsugae]
MLAMQSAIKTRLLLLAVEIVQMESMVGFILPFLKVTVGLPIAMVARLQVG